jgi:hypothetical protein
LGQVLITLGYWIGTVAEVVHVVAIVRGQPHEVGGRARRLKVVEECIISFGLGKDGSAVRWDYPRTSTRSIFYVGEVYERIVDYDIFSIITEVTAAGRVPGA